MQEVSFKDVIGRLQELNFPEVDVVIGIARGGIVPASLVAYHLGCELEFIQLNYRDDFNQPIYKQPNLLLMPEKHSYAGKKILLVDDVGVSGKTMKEAMSYFEGENVKTMVFKGKNADFVLFPEIATCVQWKWKLSIQNPFELTQSGEK